MANTASTNQPIITRKQPENSTKCRQMLRKYKLQLRLQNLCSADMYKKSPKYTAQVVNTLQVQNYTKSCKTLAPKYTAVKTIKYCKRQTLQVPTNPEYSKKQYIIQHVAKCCKNTNHSLGYKISTVQKCIKSCKFQHLNTQL